MFNKAYYASPTLIEDDKYELEGKVGEFADNYFDDILHSTICSYKRTWNNYDDRAYSTTSSSAALITLLRSKGCWLKGDKIYKEKKLGIYKPSEEPRSFGTMSAIIVPSESEFVPSLKDYDKCDFTHTSEMFYIYSQYDNNEYSLPLMDAYIKLVSESRIRDKKEGKNAFSIPDKMRE